MSSDTSRSYSARPLRAKRVSWTISSPCCGTGSQLVNEHGVGERPDSFWEACQEAAVLVIDIQLSCGLLYITRYTYTYSLGQSVLNSPDQDQTFSLIPLSPSNNLEFPLKWKTSRVRRPDSIVISCTIKSTGSLLVKCNG